MTTVKIQNAANIYGAVGKPRRRNAKPVMCLETGKIYSSVTDAANAIGIDTISNLCRIIDKPNRTYKKNHYFFLAHATEYLNAMSTQMIVLNEKHVVLEAKANKTDALERENAALRQERIAMLEAQKQAMEAKYKADMQLFLECEKELALLREGTIA